MSSLDDLTLLQLFVTGRSTLAANRNLRLEKAFDAVQLMSRRDGLLASYKLTTSVRRINVRRNTPYWDLLNQLLAEHGWLATGRPIAGLVAFAFYPLPSGYALHYTPASILWKDWRSRQTGCRLEPRDLMVFVNTTWSPICDLICSGGQVYITTLSDELVWAIEERLVWLKQHDPVAEADDATVFFAAAAPLPKDIPRDVPGDVPRDVSKDVPKVSATSPSHSDSRTIASPTVDTLLHCRQGQLYLSTMLGEVAISGHQIHCGLTSTSSGTIAPVPVPLRVCCTATQAPPYHCSGGAWGGQGCCALVAPPAQSAPPSVDKLRHRAIYHSGEV